MSYVFVEEPRVWWPVKVRIPQDGGTTEIQEFEARFRIVPSSLFSDLLAQGPKAVIESVLEDWRAVTNIEKKELPFSPANRTAFMDYSYLLQALSEAYADAMLAGARKN